MSDTPTPIPEDVTPTVPAATDVGGTGETPADPGSQPATPPQDKPTKGSMAAELLDHLGLGPTDHLFGLALSFVSDHFPDLDD